MKDLLITRTAVERMRSLSQEVDTETGGLLAGTLDQTVIFWGGSPGGNSKKSAASFSTDPEHDKSELEKARQKFGRQLKYLGHWHKHPGGLASPSRGDLDQC